MVVGIVVVVVVIVVLLNGRARLCQCTLVAPWPRSVTGQQTIFLFPACMRLCGGLIGDDDEGDNDNADDDEGDDEAVWLQRQSVSPL